MFITYLINKKSDNYYTKSYFKYFNKIKKINDSNINLFEKVLRKYYYYKIDKITKIYNCFIPVSCNFENIPIFPHQLSGIFISGGVHLGKNCVIFQQVTIGSNTLNDSKNSGAPYIGDNVYIGAGAKIIGNVKIGNNVRIGANTTVARDIPDNCTVVNSDIKIIKHKEKKDNTFIKYEDFKNNIKSL